MANTTVNKVVLGTETLLDLTGDTATAADVASGKTFHLANGAQSVGTASGGGGGSAWTRVAHAEFQASTTRTSAAVLGTVECGAAVRDPSKIVYVMVRDKAGARDGYFCGSDTIMIDYPKANGGTATLSDGGTVITRNTNATNGFTSVGYSMSSAYGIYPYQINAAGKLTMRVRYNATNSKTIDGTYTVDVFVLDYPNGCITPFDVMSE